METVRLKKRAASYSETVEVDMKVGYLSFVELHAAFSTAATPLTRFTLTTLVRRWSPTYGGHACPKRSDAAMQ